MAGGLLSFAVARFVRTGRRRAWLGELVTAVVVAALSGAGATALDFGGWAEPDWRAGSFAFLGALAGVGFFRLLSLKWRS